ncbi:MAG: amidohydrolase family protein [Desulfobacterales bacterium]|nr:amidohydrolase family protein [Desulfobacterales bacterium]
MKVAVRVSVAVVIVLAGFLTPAAAQSLRLEDLHVVDWHAHTAGLGYGGSGAFVNEEMRENFRFQFFLRWVGVTERELEAEGDQLVIKRISEYIARSRLVDQLVVLAMDGIVDRNTGLLDERRTQIYVPNDFVAREVAKYPNLLFGASINPNRPDAIERLEQAASQGAVLVKWLPSIMDIDPSDESFIPFYRRMAALNIPLLSHAGMEKSFAHARDELSDPMKLLLPLKHGVTVIAAHMAATGRSEGQDNFERLLSILPAYPNFYADISSLTQINRLGYLVKALNIPWTIDHMIYGTDWPLQHFPVVSPWFHVKHIGLANAWRISGIRNLWDRDVALKQALGVPDHVFTRIVGVLANRVPKPSN